MIFPPQRQLGSFMRQSQPFMRQNDFMFPSRGFQQMPTQGNPIGGLLQRFMGGSHQQFGHTALRGVEGLSNTLNNVQQVLRVVDTAAPIVKQYGPFVKNLPAMYRMMRAFKDIESTESTESTDTTHESNKRESNKRESYHWESSSSSSSFDESSGKRTREGQSTPKLFI